MTEAEARAVLAKLSLAADMDTLLPHKITRTMQTAKQIGSAWFTEHISLLHLYEYDNGNDYFRIVIE